MTHKFMGSIALYRKLECSEIWSKPAWWVKVWLHILLNVSHKTEGIYRRGSGLFTRYSIWENCHLIGDRTEPETVDNVIRWLCKTTQITTRKTTRGMIISVTKYEDYQIPTTYKTIQETTQKTIPQNESETEVKHAKNDMIYNNVNNVDNVNNKDLTQSEVFDYWNSKPELPKVMKITKQRAVKLKERLKEPVFASKYKAIIDLICISDFLTGRKTGKDHDNWKVSFDWLIHNDTNYTKILEGKYNNKVNVVKKPQLYIHQGTQDLISRKEHYEQHPEEYIIPEIENKYKDQPEVKKRSIEERNADIEQAKIKAKELLSQLGIKNNV